MSEQHHSPCLVLKKTTESDSGLPKRVPFCLDAAMPALTASLPGRQRLDTVLRSQRLLVLDISGVGARGDAERSVTGTPISWKNFHAPGVDVARSRPSPADLFTQPCRAIAGTLTKLPLGMRSALSPTWNSNSLSTT